MSKLVWTIKDHWSGDTHFAFCAGLKLYIQDMDGDFYTWRVKSVGNGRLIASGEVHGGTGKTYSQMYAEAKEQVIEAARNELIRRLESSRAAASSKQ